MPVRIESIVDTRWFEKVEFVRIAIAQNKRVSGHYCIPGLNEWAVGHRVCYDRGVHYCFKEKANFLMVWI
jgi:hypothetical protein